MPDERFYLISYDIREPRRLKRIAKAMEDFAVRTQYSVFEANLTDASYRKLLKRIEALLAPEDSFRVYRLCPECRGRVEVRGGSPPVESPTHYVF